VQDIHSGVILSARQLETGIEAQREALRHFAKAEGFEVARKFVEVETGKGSPI
jgi:DNA invertase Pin-like site-specific DNA recombinase